MTPARDERRRGAGGSSGREDARTRRVRRRRRLVWPMLAAVTVVGVLFIGVYPTRTYLAQRASLGDARHQRDVLQAENDQLQQRVQALNTDAEIEKLARERYNLVRPGEEAYAILPAPPPAVSLPSVWPFTDLAADLQR